MDRMVRKGSAGYIGWENLTFMVKLIIKNPDFYGKFYHLKIVGSYRGVLCM
jgi:hypothetical protein